MPFGQISPQSLLFALSLFWKSLKIAFYHYKGLQAVRDHQDLSFLPGLSAQVIEQADSLTPLTRPLTEKSRSLSPEFNVRCSACKAEKRGQMAPSFTPPSGMPWLLEELLRSSEEAGHPALRGVI